MSCPHYSNHIIVSTWSTSTVRKQNTLPGHEFGNTAGSLHYSMWWQGEAPVVCLWTRVAVCQTPPAKPNFVSARNKIEPLSKKRIRGAIRCGELDEIPSSGMPNERRRKGRTVTVVLPDTAFLFTYQVPGIYYFCFLFLNKISICCLSQPILRCAKLYRHVEFLFFDTVMCQGVSWFHNMKPANPGCFTGNSPMTKV